MRITDLVRLIAPAICNERVSAKPDNGHKKPDCSSESTKRVAIKAELSWSFLKIDPPSISLGPSKLAEDPGY